MKAKRLESTVAERESLTKERLHRVTALWVAQPMEIVPMKIDFSAVIKDLDGDAVKDGEKDATLGRVACTALLASYADEQSLAAEDKVKRFRLAEVAARGGEQEMKIDDVALVKTLIGKAFAPLIVARAYDIIEPPAAEPRA